MSVISWYLLYVVWMPFYLSETPWSRDTVMDLVYANNPIQCNLCLVTYNFKCANLQPSLFDVSYFSGSCKSTLPLHANVQHNQKSFKFLWSWSKYSRKYKRKKQILKSWFLEFNEIEKIKKVTKKHQNKVFYQNILRWLIQLKIVYQTKSFIRKGKTCHFKIKVSLTLVLTFKPSLYPLPPYSLFWMYESTFQQKI